jgi:gluconolactonase
MQIDRRQLLAGASAAAATTFSQSAFGAWEPSERYPDPAIRTLDPSFNKYRIYNAALERLATGYRWAEGPCWFGDGRYLLWSDAAMDRISRWDEITVQVSIYRTPANKPNGLTRDRQGRLLTCEHMGRRLTRTEHDGTITTSSKARSSVRRIDLGHRQQLLRQRRAARTADPGLSDRQDREDHRRHR